MVSENDDHGGVAASACRPITAPARIQYRKAHYVPDGACVYETQPVLCESAPALSPSLERAGGFSRCGQGNPQQSTVDHDTGLGDLNRLTRAVDGGDREQRCPRVPCARAGRRAHTPNRTRRSRSTPQDQRLHRTPISSLLRRWSYHSHRGRCLPWCWGLRARVRLSSLSAAPYAGMIGPYRGPYAGIIWAYRSREV